MRLDFDHLVLATEELDRGIVEVQLPWLTGGQHAAFGTHNRLLGLGPEDYLELIAIDPDAQRPPYTRWYNLDGFSGATRVTNWVLRTDDLDGAMAALGDGYGRIHDLTRDALRWRMAVPESGILPFDNCAPALIQWDTPFPAPALRDQGHRLRSLTVSHPEVTALQGSLAPYFTDPRVSFEAGPAGLKASLTQGDQQIALP